MPVEIYTYPTPLQPRQVRLELTNSCPARCFPCHRTTSMARPVGFMPFSLLEKCLADIQAFPDTLTEVVPTGWGEVMLYPEWEQALQLIARKLPHTRMVIPTNGILLRDTAVERLAQVPTLKLVNFSVNAFLPGTYEAYSGLPAKHLETIENAVLKLKQLRPEITLWFSMVREARFQSPREVELFQDKWGKIGLVQISQAEYAGVPGKEPLVPVSLPCRSIFSDMVIFSGGEALSCCYIADPVTELVVGDANRQSLLDCWHSKEFNKIRQLHNEGKRAELSTCKGCTFS